MLMYMCATWDDNIHISHKESQPVSQLSAKASCCFASSLTGRAGASPLPAPLMTALQMPSALQARQSCTDLQRFTQDAGAMLARLGPEATSVSSAAPYVPIGREAAVLAEDRLLTAAFRALDAGCRRFGEATMCSEAAERSHQESGGCRTPPHQIHTSHACFGYF